MKRNLLTSVWAVFLLCAAGITNIQAQNTYVTFSVDMSSNLVNGTFNPPVPAYVGGTPYGGTGSDAVYSRGIFDGWAYPGLQLVQVGNSSVYTNTADDNNAQDQSDGNMNFQYDDTQTGGEAQSDYANRMAYLPPGNNASLVLPTAYFGDGGPATTNNITFQVDMSEQIELGAFHPGSGDYVVVAGSYESFFLSPTPVPVVLTNDPNIVITNYNFSPPVIESNVWVGTGAISTDSSKPVATVTCGQEFKYVTEPEGNWDSPQYPNSDPDSGNRFYTMSGDQTLPLVNFNDAPYTPLANVTLNVDMSGVIKYDPNYEPNSVTVWGTFNGWANGVTMTNDPAPNTNIFSAVTTMPEGTANTVQVRYTNSVVAANTPAAPWVYDYLDDAVFNNNARRIVTLPVTPTPVTTNLSVFYFLDLAPDDYLPVATPVLFSVNMAGAVQTNGTPFNPGSDSVYINGMFANGGETTYPQTWYAWEDGVNPVPGPPGYLMKQEGSSTIYTNTIIMSAGTPVALSYQYGIDPGSVFGGPLENEAPPGANHLRVVRSTIGNYSLPVDTFTNQPYMEPLFAPGNIDGFMGTLAGGNLSVGNPMGGTVPVSWLGRPGAHLQVKNDLLSGSWQDIIATDGTNWVSGYSSTNGFVSQTNWPAGSKAFFRLVKP